MTITREWIAKRRKWLSQGYEPLSHAHVPTSEELDLIEIGLAVRDKEPGLVEAIHMAWMNGHDYNGMPSARAALDAITAYRSE